MKVTVHHRGTLESFTLERQGLELGGNPGGDGVSKNRLGTWSGRFSLEERGLVFNLRAGSRPPTALNGETLDGGRIVDVRVGDVIVAGAVTITIGYLATTLPASEPLATDERDLLARIAAAPDDDDARRVIADFWQQHGDEARGTLIHAGYADLLETCDQLVRQHAPRWLEPLLIAGFERDELDFERGFVAPIVYAATEELARSPAALRLSPVHYRPTRLAWRGAITEVHEATRVTAAGATGRVAIKMPAGNYREATELVEREIKILRRFDESHLPRIVDVAIAREGSALVMPWAGGSLADVLVRLREARRAPGEAVAIAIGIQLCRALAAVHAAKVVHSEVRPDHVLIGDGGHITLCDFAFASCDLKRPTFAERPARRGQFGFLSPEQVRGLALDASCDVFALAVLIAQLVTGEYPISGVDTDFSMLEAIRDVRHEIPPTQSRLATKLRTLIVRDREPRSSAAVLGLELARIAEDARLRTEPAVIAELVQSL